MTTSNVSLRSKANQPRPRKPWKDNATGKMKGGFWQFRFDGKYINLTPYGAPTTVTGKNGSRAERNAAIAARDKFIHEQEKARHASYLDSQRGDDITVGEVLGAYIKTLSAASQKTHGVVIRNFLDGKTRESKGIKAHRGVADVPAKHLDYRHIATFCDAHPNWSAATKDHRKKMIRAGLNWAMSDDGGKLIDRHPLQNWKPKIAWGVRKSYFAAADESLIRKHCPSELALLLDACIELGVRPGEAMAVTTEHVKTTPQGHMYWRLEAHEWKNGKKSGKPRIIPLSQRWELHTKKVLAKSTGRTHLFTNSQGNPWKSVTASAAFRAARERCYKAEYKNMSAEQRTKFGDAKDDNELLVLYSGRHTFITRALVAGESAYRVATACGTSENHIRTTYSHMQNEHDVLRAVVMAAAG